MDRFLLCIQDACWPPLRALFIRPNGTGEPWTVRILEDAGWRAVVLSTTREEFEDLLALLRLEHYHIDHLPSANSAWVEPKEAKS